MSISFSGLASGLDTSSWIEALTSIRQMSVTSLQNKKTSISNEQAELNKIQSMFSNVQTALDRLTDSKFGGTNDVFIQKTVDTNGSEAFTATVTSSAIPENYKIYVAQLATATVAKSANTVSQYVSTDTQLSDLGVKSGSFTIWVDGEATGHTVNIDKSKTISQFNTYLKNTEHLDVSLTVDSEGHLTLIGDNNTSIRASAQVDDSNFYTKLGFEEVHDLANNKTYFRTKNSFFAMGEDTTLVHSASDNVYTDNHSVSTGKIKINYLEFNITGTTTLGDLIDAINNHQDESLATASWDASSGKLKLTATNEGYSHITIDDSINNTGFAVAFGLDDAETQETGQNAIININGSDNIYIGGAHTTAISKGTVSPATSVLTPGTCTEAQSINLSTLMNSGTVTNSTRLSDLGISQNGKFSINGQVIEYSSNNTVDALVSLIRNAGQNQELPEDKQFSASFDSATGKITITASEVGDKLLDFESTIDEVTSDLPSKFGFTKQDYVKVSHMLDGAKIYNDGKLVGLQSTTAINGSTARYYSEATSITLTGNVSDSLSSFGDGENSLGLSGNYEIKVNGHAVNFNAGESMGILLSKISEINGATASYTDNKLVITSDNIGTNLTIEDVTGDFSVKMGYVNLEVIDSTELNPGCYNPYTRTASANVGKIAEHNHPTLMSTNLEVILGDTVTGATKLWELGIYDGNFNINSTQINVNSNWTVTQLCNTIDQNVSGYSASYNATDKKIVLRSDEGYENTTNPSLNISRGTSNLSDVLGWTRTMFTSIGEATSGYDFMNQVNTVTPEKIVNASNVSSIASYISDYNVIGLADEAALQAFSAYVSQGNTCAGKTICLTQDIALTGAWTPIGYTGDEYAVHYNFAGNFNGNGKTISNMTTSTGQKAGLFAGIDGGSVSNLAIVNANVSSSTIEAGVLAGTAINAYISNCYTTGSVSASQDYVGGLVGRITNTTIDDCYSLGSVAGRNMLGGLVGSADSSTIEDSGAYNYISPSGYTSIGSFVGKSVSTSYNNCTYYDSRSGVGDANGTVTGLQRDMMAAPPRKSANVSITGSTSLGSLNFSGQGVLVVNGVSTTSLSGSDTVNSVIQKINDVQSTTNVRATLSGSRIILESLTPGQEIAVTDENGSNASLILGIHPQYATNDYTSSQVTTGVYGNETENSCLATTSSLVCNNSAQLNKNVTTGEFYINDYKFTLTNSTTLGNLMQNIRNADIGVDVSFDSETGKLNIYSTNGADIRMQEAEGDNVSNFLRTFGYIHDTHTNNYTTNYDAFDTSICFDTNASITTTPNLFNSTHMINEGNFFINGIEFNIDENTTLNSLMEEINSNDYAFAQAELVTSGNEIKLKITSQHPSGDPLSVVGGTSNFTDIVKLTYDSTELVETEQNQTPGTDTVYQGRANLSSKLVGNTQFSSFNDKSLSEGNFAINGVTFTITDSTTLGGILEDINNSAAGVTTYWNSQTGILTIASNAEGDNKINFQDGDSNFLTVMRVTEDSAQILGTNGYYNFSGGRTCISNSNVITSDSTHIDGLTIYLNGTSKTSGNKLVADKLNISNDTTYLEASVLDFVNNYNELITELDSATKTTGIFHSDVGLKSLASQLKSTLLSSTSGTGSTYTMLAQLGVSTAAPGAMLTDNTNLLTLDLNKLHREVTTNISEVKKFMLGNNSDYSNGVMTRLSNLMFNTMKSTGFFATRNSMYGSQMNRYDSLITSATSRIANYRSSLETKFASMEKLISNLQTAYSKMSGTLGINIGASSASSFF